MQEQKHTLKTRGEIEIISSNGCVWKSPNFIVNLASETVAKMLNGTFTGTLYRMAIGNGGYAGLPPTRVLPNDDWYLYTGLLGASKVSKPIALRTMYTDGHVTSITMNCVFSGSDHPYVDSKFSEACLILGKGTADTQVGLLYKGEDDVLYAYRTFDEQDLPTASDTTLAINWTIFVENA